MRSRSSSQEQSRSTFPMLSRSSFKLATSRYVGWRGRQAWHVGSTSVDATFFLCGQHYQTFLERHLDGTCGKSCAPLCERFLRRNVRPCAKGFCVVLCAPVRKVSAS